MAWDYNQYMNSLKSETTDYNAALGELRSFAPEVAQNAQNIYKEILAQQKAGSAEYWSQGKLASKDAAAADFALRLTENGISSLRELGGRPAKTGTGQFDEDGKQVMMDYTEYFNKSTGEALPDWDRVALGNNSFSKLQYNVHFMKDGTAMPYTSNIQSEWVQFRESAKPIASILLAAYGVPYVSAALQGTTIAGMTLAKGSFALTAASAGTVSLGAGLLAGKDFDDALKSALVSGLTAGATAGFADTIGQTLGFDAGSIASKAAGSAIIAGAKAGITDENVLQSMATAAVATYLSNKTPAFDATEREGSLAKLNEDSFGMTTDFGSGANYSLTSGLKFPSTEGINVDNRGVGEGYELTSGTTPFTGLQTATSPNLTAMGGGQGVTATRNDGTTLAGADFTTGPSMKDVKTVAKIAGVLTATNELVDLPSSLSDESSTEAQNKNKYRNAPLAGFKMVKYDDPVSGSSKYIPFINEDPLLPPPTGYNKTYVKGGFVSKKQPKAISTGLASRRN